MKKSFIHNGRGPIGDRIPPRKRFPISGEICYNISSNMRLIKLPFKVKKAILACGADLKGAFALAKSDTAYLFDGFGDLASLENFTRYEKAIKGAIRKLKIIPKIVVCDLHPGYFSTQFAKDYTQYAIRTTQYEVQHHEAHIASAIVDNAIKGEVLGVAFDGTGYGIDKNLWGGEFFIGDAKNFKRIGHLDYIPMPGGEMAIKEPWRMAASYLYHTFGSGFLKLRIDFVKKMNKKRWVLLKKMIDKKINSPLTSGMGRLFDAVGSLVLNKMDAKFEAELPIELERIADPNIDERYNFDNTAKIIKGVVKDLEKRIDPSIISAKFHNSVAHLILGAAKKCRIRNVVLSGGVFQNKYLVKKTMELLNRNNFKVYTHSDIQTNDSGIPIGQIAIANARIICV